MRALTLKGWFAAAAFAVLIAAVIASLVAAPHRPISRSLVVLAPAASDLDRCRGLGGDAGKDVACQAAWRRLRAHFFGLKPTEAQP